MTEKKMAMVVDLAACIDCSACVVACKREYDVPTGEFNTFVESWDVGSYPQVSRAALPKLCNHCVDAPCVAACPTDASYFADDGTVQIDEGLCIGCRACIEACPFDMRWMHPQDNVARKCSLCHHRTQAGLLPVCVSTCPTHARVYGDLNDPDSEAAALMARGGVPILPELEIDTHVYYVGLEQTTGPEKTSATEKGGKVLA